MLYLHFCYPVVLLVLAAIVDKSDLPVVPFDSCFGSCDGKVCEVKEREKD